MKIQMSLRGNQSERVDYDVPQLPIYVRMGELAYFPNRAAPSHWHDDLEFIAVLSGRMRYNVNGAVVLLRAGEGIFVNTRQLHFGFADDGPDRDCRFLCLLLHPSLAGPLPYLMEKYGAAILQNAAMPYVLLQSGVPWQQEILCAVRAVWRAKGSAAAPLETVGLFYHMLAQLYEHRPADAKPANGLNPHVAALRRMIGYVQEHYAEKITLSELAAAGGVCKSNCCRIFSEHLGKSFGRYLTEYRLNKSLALLRNTDKTVTEIAYQTGFSGASYFTEQFTKSMGMTPTRYRKGMHA